MKTTSLKSTFSMMILSAASLLLGCNQMAIEESEAVEDPSDVVIKEHVAETEQALVTPPVADGLYRIRGLNSLMCLDIPQGCDDPSNPDTCLSGADHPEALQREPDQRQQHPGVRIHLDG